MAELYINQFKTAALALRNLLISYTSTIFINLAAVLIYILIWQIPFVTKFFVGIYEENIVIKSIVDIFINTFTTKF